MSDVSQGPGWWLASDNKWYPPESAPGYQPPTGQVPGMTPNYPTGPNMITVTVPADALGRPYAGWWLRVAATIIDSLIFGAIASVLAVASGGRSSAMTLVSIFLMVLYQALMVTSKGQTLGNMAAGTMVVDAVTGASVTQGKAWGRAAMDALLRYGGLLLFAIPYFVDILMPLWDQKNQTLHDKVAGTVVVKKGAGA